MVLCCFLGEFCAEVGAFWGELMVEADCADVEPGFVIDGGALEYKVVPDGLGANPLTGGKECPMYAKGG